MTQDEHEILIECRDLLRRIDKRLNQKQASVTPQAFAANVLANLVSEKITKK